MAIIIYNDGDLSVGTIAERNAIVKRFEGMLVNVADATADANVGGGAATYRWDEAGDKWVTVWVENTPTLNFTTEKKVLSGGIVTADNIPADNSVWSARVIDSVSGRSLADARPTVTSNSIDVGTSDYDGHYLEYTYAYGSIVAQIEAVIGEVYTKEETDAKIAQLAPAETKVSVDSLGVDAATVSGFTVGVSVPSGAVFTDTVYTKPSSEPISYIDGLQAALDGKLGATATAATATKLATARTIALSGDVTGSVSFD